MNPELNPESYFTVIFFNLFQQEQKLIVVVPNKFVDDLFERTGSWKNY